MSHYASNHLLKIKSATRLELLQMRLLIGLGLGVMALFVWYFFGYVQPGDPWLYGLLTFAMVFKLHRTLYEWYHYFDLRVPPKPHTEKQYTVDILTTFCQGEPREMVKKSLLAMKAVRYPHQTYLCDEENDPDLKAFCEAHGIHHVTRKTKRDAKAGNINNALKNHCTGELCVVMDPDHIPRPEFLDEVVAYFDDPRIGYVQIIQAYHNSSESLIARGAAQQSYHFYGPTMICQGNYGTVQSIGANCTFRRRALDSIGGHAAGLAEDLHTAMRLHAKRWKSVYVPAVLTEGLVPATLSAYYKQQLKWARGCFELLFEVFPLLAGRFSFQQKLQYFFSPLYYLFGLVNMIDLVVPIFSLITTKVPWLTDIETFAAYYTPLLAIGIVIRLYAQRWLAAPGERGLHIWGGLLRLGTWWIYLIGFVYSVLRIKVPYIPTPKEGAFENEWAISMPNVAMLLVSAGALAYGLAQDLNPYSTLMAGFAFTNIVLLAFIIGMAQQKMLAYASGWWQKLRSWLAPLPAFHFRFDTTTFIYKTVQKVGFAMGLMVFGSLLSFIFLSQNDLKKLEDLKVVNNNRGNGDFLLGVYRTNTPTGADLAQMQTLSHLAKKKMNLVPIYLEWGPESVEAFPYGLVDSIYKMGGIPLITWEPWGKGLDSGASEVDKLGICQQITRGFYTDYMRDFAYIIQYLRKPVMIRFAQQPDNPIFPWGEAAGNSATDYQYAWRYVYQYFIGLGVSNVAWVWQTWKPENMDRFYPGERYVDWVGVSCLNYGKYHRSGSWQHFENLYSPFHQKLKNYYKPVLITEMGSTPYGGNQADWLANALEKIKLYYNEVWGMVLYQNDHDQLWPEDWKTAAGENTVAWTFANPSQAAGVFSSVSNQEYFKQPGHPHFLQHFISAHPSLTHSRCHNITGSGGRYTLKVSDTAFYIKGIAYNTNDDWRNGNMPLSLSRLRKDMKAIHQMGANTVRRYGYSLYDDNLLNTAAQNGLKVMYGFWFEPEVDYLMDSAKVKKYMAQVEAQVQKYKNHPAILTWGLGNETWGLMKHHFTQPYLTEVRLQYILMLEYLANRIHEIDPEHPVVTASEHSNELLCELIELRNNAPSVDIVGVNSYYLQQVSKLQKITQKADSTRPYLFSEFGPLGYWDTDYSKYNTDNTLVEDSDYEKSFLYAYEWKNHVLKNKGYNLGGVAFCWSDRLEGTATWFGLTDVKSRKKPAYFALEKVWTGREANQDSIPPFFILGPKEKIRPGHYYTFKAWNEHGLPEKYRYKWVFRREDYLDELPGLVRTFENGRRIMLKIPQEPSNYRLYLYVTEGDKVLTHSFPIAVKYGRK